MRDIHTCTARPYAHAVCTHKNARTRGKSVHTSTRCLYRTVLAICTHTYTLFVQKRARDLYTHVHFFCTETCTRSVHTRTLCLHRNVHAICTHVHSVQKRTRDLYTHTYPLSVQKRTRNLYTHVHAVHTEAYTRSMHTTMFYFSILHVCVYHN